MPAGQLYLIHAFMTDAGLNITGYFLSFSGANDHAAPLIHLLCASQADSPLRQRPVFIQAHTSLLHDPLLDGLMDLPLVLVLPADAAVDDAGIQRMKELKKQGLRFAASGFTSASGGTSWLALADWIMVAAPTLSSQDTRQAIARLERPAGQLIACGIATEALHQASRAAGMGRFLGDWFLRPPMQDSKTITPGQAGLLELLSRVQQDADDAELERLFKRDAALSFRMLKYINSAGFGLFCEIESIRHAIQMLGRKELYRWLTLLLVSAGTSSPPVLAISAVIRGRFTELLGKELLGRQHMASLFIAGAFSLLDAMLEVPMAQAVDSLALAEAIYEALVDRTGIYAPFLQLVESTGQLRQDPAAVASALGLSADQVNQAHLSALAWVESLGL